MRILLTESGCRTVLSEPLNLKSETSCLEIRAGEVVMKIGMIQRGQLLRDFGTWMNI